MQLGFSCLGGDDARIRRRFRRVEQQCIDCMKREVKFVICVGNSGCAASLELRKVYQVIPDEAGERQHQTRVIDESGEDYLYPANYFVPVQLPQAVERAVRKAIA